MPSLQRLKHPFRRPTHYYTINEPSPTPRQRERQREKDMQRAHDKIENDLDDGRVGPRGRDSPDELPVIIDRGPYRGHIYPREQLFFNSIMMASDIEPIYAGPPGGELRQEVHRTSVRRPVMQGDRKLPPRPVPSEYLTASQNAENLRRWEERNSKTDAIGRTQHPRPVPSEYLTATQNAENLRRWEQRYGRTPTVRQAQVSERIPDPPRQPSPPRGPLTPGTREWDGFMDFPSDYSVSLDPSGEVTVDAANPVRIPTTSTPATQSHLTAASETTFDSVLLTNPSPPTARANSSQTQAQVQASTRLPGHSSIGTEQPELITWNSALNSIPRNEAVDPAIIARIRERAQRSFTTLVPEHGDTHPIATTDADIVPISSHPIAGSEFHDRLHPEQTSRLQSLELAGENEEQQQEQLLPNGASPGHYSHSSSSSTLYRAPTPASLPLRGGNESPTQLTNGVPPGYYPSSSSSSDDSSNGSRHHPPSPPDRVPEHVFFLLCSILTPSELTLHYDVVHDSAPPPPPALGPPSNATSDTPVGVRLVQKLHTAVYGLQDRVTGVEEDLIPELSTHLEKKHLQVRELDLENLSLQNEVAELKRLVDFSNKVLAGCWEREWEVWRTLVDIQRRREKIRGPLARMFSRASTSNSQDSELLDYHRPEGYVAQPSQPFGRAAQGTLKKKELDALLLMAKQNVGILIEDLGEMTGLVEAYQKRNEVDEAVLPVEGSWRDV